MGIWDDARVGICARHKPDYLGLRLAVFLIGGWD